jgi:glycosyltransferase involved in cell wall biosynthesis
MLHRFWTGFAFSSSALLGRLAARFTQRLHNRIVHVLPNQLRTLPRLDWQARKASKAAGEEAAYFARNQRFQQAIPDAEIAAADVIVGFDTSAWLLARRAQKMGKPFVLDQSIGHPVAKEKVFEKVRAQFPEWSSSAPRKAPEMVAAEQEEHQLADIIVVPSQFVQSTLQDSGVSGEKIRVIPFGTDLQMFHPASPPRPICDEVVFLFVGGLTARKGLPVLLNAWKTLAAPHARLRLVGRGDLPELPPCVDVLGPRSRQQVADIMRHADVLVFPSYFEGLAQVQVEALASGLAVISTPESGAETVVNHGINGLVVPAGDEAALVAAMKTLAENRPLLQSMKTTAVNGRSTLGWSTYGDRWAALLNSLPVPTQG